MKNLTYYASGVFIKILFILFTLTPCVSVADSINIPLKPLPIHSSITPDKAYSNAKMKKKGIKANLVKFIFDGYEDKIILFIMGNEATIKSLSKPILVDSSGKSLQNQPPGSGTGHSNNIHYRDLTFDKSLLKMPGIGVKVSFQE
ncbi:hypothetical protein [Spartinivicinus poritis]|uniref:Uncharacterized protein n=1 Tax=Spartinivicinus poritis TaxID=2994640 RepID=A0ABT5UDN2_9GAMM|nr:hypothetical protein [Spartinivicinus sp. A2-2]MDE1464116.1 hypothetical protein [Spartinivicinus sp. A2-2]